MSNAGALMQRKVNDINLEWLEGVLAYNYLHYAGRVEGFVTLHGTVLKNAQESDDCLVYAINTEIVKGKMEYLQNIDVPEEFHVIDFVDTDKFLTALNEWMKTAITLVRLPTLRAFDQYVFANLASREREVYMPLIRQCRDLVTNVIQTILNDNEVQAAEQRRQQEIQNKMARTLHSLNRSEDSKLPMSLSGVFFVPGSTQPVDWKDSYVQNETRGREPAIRKQFLETEFELQLNNISRELHRVEEEEEEEEEDAYDNQRQPSFNDEEEEEEDDDDDNDDDDSWPEPIESTTMMDKEQVRNTNLQNIRDGLEELMENMGLK